MDILRYRVKSVASGFELLPPLFLGIVHSISNTNKKNYASYVEGDLGRAGPQ